MMCACEEWVELKPENSVTFENAFDTEKDIEAALFGAEQSLRVNMTSAPYSPELELQRNCSSQCCFTLY